MVTNSHTTKNKVANENNSKSDKDKIKNWIYDNPEDAIELVEEIKPRIIYKKDNSLFDSVPDEILENHSKVRESGQGKHQIYSSDDGSQLETLKGIEGLPLLSSLAFSLGIDSPDLRGRGYCGRYYTNEIKKKVEEKGQSEKP
jgi:hypothetical protein